MSEQFLVLPLPSRARVRLTGVDAARHARGLTIACPYEPCRAPAYRPCTRTDVSGRRWETRLLHQIRILTAIRDLDAADADASVRDKTRSKMPRPMRAPGNRSVAVPRRSRRLTAAVPTPTRPRRSSAIPDPHNRPGSRTPTAGARTARRIRLPAR